MSEAKKGAVRAKTRVRDDGYKPSVSELKEPAEIAVEPAVEPAEIAVALSAPTTNYIAVSATVRRCTNFSCRVQTFTAASGVHMSLGSCPMCLTLGTTTADTVI